jgi:hypothetical protein
MLPLGREQRHRLRSPRWALCLVLMAAQVESELGEEIRSGAKAVEEQQVRAAPLPNLHLPREYRTKPVFLRLSGSPYLGQLRPALPPPRLRARAAHDRKDALTSAF